MTIQWWSHVYREYRGPCLVHADCETHQREEETKLYDRKSNTTWRWDTESRFCISSNPNQTTTFNPLKPFFIISTIYSFTLREKLPDMFYFFKM